MASGARSYVGRYAHLRIMHPKVDTTSLNQNSDLPPTVHMLYLWTTVDTALEC